MLGFKDEDDTPYTVLITTMHVNRNNIAHLAIDIEEAVTEVSEAITAYKYYNKLQKDLDMIFAGTGLTLSARDVFKAYGITLETDLSDELSDELPDVETY